MPPSRELALSVAQTTAQGIRHDPLLDQVSRVAGQPEYLGTEPARPKVDRRRTQGRVLPHHSRNHVVAAPPEEEETSENHRGAQSVVYAPHAVVSVYLAQAVHRAGVHALRLLGGVLDLKTGLDVLYRCGDEANRRAGEDSRNPVAQRREVCR